MQYRSFILAFALLLAKPPVSASAMGYGPFPAFTGTRLPSTASVFGSVAVGPLGVQPYTLGYFLDENGDTAADAADVANAIGASDGIRSLLGAYVSPSDPGVTYILYSPQNGGAVAIVALRRSGETWTRVGNPMPYPDQLSQYATATWNVVKARKLFPQFQSSWTNIVSLRRLTNGSDSLLVTATQASGGHIHSRFALVVDGSDTDPYADHWSSVEEFADVEAMTLDEQGGVLARRSHLDGPSDVTDEFLRLTPRTDGGAGPVETPNSIDESSRVEVGFVAAAANCWGDIDYGTGRFFFGEFMGTLNLDSEGRPIPGTIRPFEDLRVGVVPWESAQILLDPSGTPFAFGNDPQSDIAIIRWVDTNFDGLVGNRFGAPFEAFPVFYENDLPNPFLINASVAKAKQLPLSHGAASLHFDDCGDYSPGQAFRFRFGGQDFERVWVSADGIVSFVGPVAGEATPSGLAELRGVIAPAWSDRWDTSDARIYAGYSPAETSFRDGSPVLAFSIEWRGLRDPSWDAGRSFSMRLLLFSDGTFRTDYGAIDEVTTAPFVVGYSGPGTSSSSIAVDPSEHSWGNAPAGSGAERVATAEFSSTNALGHIETRWLGYPERLEAPGPTPIVAGLKLTKGKLSFTAAGSNVEAGARLVVDGAESFPLKKNAAGTKWVVAKKARSVPGGVSIAAALAGGDHTIVVVNPDGTTSAPVSL